MQKPGNVSDSTPIFDGVNKYTRRGDFSLDKNGYLVNGAGYYLQGVKIDPSTGNPAGSTPEVLRFQNDFLPSQATTKIDYRANLASYPLTTKHQTSVPGSELLRSADFVSNPRVLGTAATPFGNTAVPGNARNNFATTPAPISANTKLAPVSGSDTLPVGFAQRRYARAEDHQCRCHHDQDAFVLHGRRCSCGRAGHDLYPYRYGRCRRRAHRHRHRDRQCVAAIERVRHRRDHVELRYGERLYAGGRFDDHGGRRIPGPGFHRHRYRPSFGRRHGGHRRRDRQ